MPCKILIVDDHAIVRAGLATLLAAHAQMQVVGTAADGRAALERIEEDQPHVVLMDILLPDTSGIDLTCRVHQLHPDIRILMMTAYVCPDEVKQALDAGAIGFLYKNVTAAQLVEAILLALANRPALAPEATGALINALREPQVDALTAREQTVLSMTARGLTNAEIAYELGISRFTVKNHLSSIFDKLGVMSRTEATSFALKHGLITLE